MNFLSCVTPVACQIKGSWHALVFVRHFSDSDLAAFGKIEKHRFLSSLKPPFKAWGQLRFGGCHLGGSSGASLIKCDVMFVITSGFSVSVTYVT